MTPCYVYMARRSSSRYDNGGGTAPNGAVFVLVMAETGAKRDREGERDTCSSKEQQTAAAAASSNAGTVQYTRQEAKNKWEVVGEYCLLFVYFYLSTGATRFICLHGKLPRHPPFRPDISRWPCDRRQRQVYIYMWCVHQLASPSTN